jgi:multiple sugar transport system ATP-binding protein
VTALTVEGLAKRFGRTQALAGVDLAVGADELVVVLGPTGAGKTTLLRLIAGLEAPDAGRVLLAGADATVLPPAERDVALVFQNFSLYPEWTVRRNLEFPLRAPGRRLDPAEIARRVAWAGRLLRIEGLMDRPANRLSGGQMQRVAIGRAIVRRPRLFLMDEPLTNLDAKLREALRVELAVLRRELRTPMVYVTHDQAEALSMADRIVVLGGGRVLQVGTPEEVYRRPASPAVARQLGQPAINLIAAEARAGRWTTAGGLPLLASDAAPGSRCTLGVRPEDVLGEGGEAEATVAVVENLGAQRVALIDWGGERLRLTVDRDLRPGDRLRPRLDPERVVLFVEGSAAAHRPGPG